MDYLALIHSACSSMLRNSPTLLISCSLRFRENNLIFRKALKSELILKNVGHIQIWYQSILQIRPLFQWLTSKWNETQTKGRKLEVFFREFSDESDAFTCINRFVQLAKTVRNFDFYFFK